MRAVGWSVARSWSRQANYLRSILTVGGWCGRIRGAASHALEILSVRNDPRTQAAHTSEMSRASSALTGSSPMLVER